MTAAARLNPVRHVLAEPPAPGTAVELADGVLWARLPLPMRLDHVNSYILDDGDGWSVLDTGFDSPACRECWQKLLAGPLAGRPVRRVIVTHHHADHIGLAGWFQTEHGAELWTTLTAWLYARMLRLDEQPLPPPELVAFWRSAGMPADMLARRAGERPLNTADRVAALPLGFRRVAAGERLRAAGREWQVHVGSGHAPEHATFWSRNCHLVLGGDALLPRITPHLGVNASEPEYDPVGDWLRSCAYFSTLAREDHLVLPGHHLPYRGLPQRLGELAERHKKALERLWMHLSEPRTAAECFPPLFRSRIDDGVYALALAESLGHLNHLRNRGAVVRERGDDGAWLWRRRAGLALPDFGMPAEGIA